MMKRTMLFSLCAAALGSLIAAFAAVDEASAVPAFARQTGKPCSGCHSIWPKLLAPGRDFKVSGYTDVAGDYPRIESDNLDLLRLSSPPLAVSIISFPYSQVSGEQSQTVIPDQVYIYFAGRITPGVGAFVVPQWYSDTGQFSLNRVKLVAAMPAGDNTVGLVLLKSDVGGADPYNTIRYSAYTTVHTPSVLDADHGRANGDLFQFSNTENEGVLAYGKFLSNMVYAAAGMFRGDGGAAQVSSDPPDYFGRLVFEYAITGETTASLGGFVYTGRQAYDHTTVAGPIYEDAIRRTGADFQYQVSSAPHIFEAVALYMSGKDSGAWDGAGGFSDILFSGYYGELSYFYDRKYGITVSYDSVQSAQDDSIDKKGPTCNIAYLPWLNTKLAVEYSDFALAAGARERDTNLYVRLNF